MLKSIASKLMWAGKATVFMMGLALMLALAFGMASTAFGANGGNFILGSLNNSATAITKLTGNVNGPAMQVVNNNADLNDTALSLLVDKGEEPIRVNSAGKVTNLNADKVDGKDSTMFAGTGNSAYRGGSSYCNSPEVLSIPFSVNKESLVYASGHAEVQANGNPGVGTLMDIDLRNGTNTTTLAQAGFSSQSYSSDATDIRSLVAEGVLKTGISSPSEAPFLVTPGNNYVLRLNVRLNGSTCSPSSPVLWDSSLSYILLGKP
jgi:hypothetical protein